MTGFISYSENGKTLLGTVRVPETIERLKTDRRFACGIFYGLHRDVGEDLIDFRSFNGELGRGSLQLVIDKRTGACYADIDAHNPYQDVVRIVGHFGELVGHWWKRTFTRKDATA